MRIQLLWTILFLVSISLLGCQNETKKNTENQEKASPTYSFEPKEAGYIKFLYSGETEESYSNFVQILQANPGVEIVGSLDHQANATNVGLEMPFAKVIFVYNQFQATPIISENPLAALDMPTRISFYQSNEKANIQLFDESYLISKYNLNQSIPNAQSASQVYAKVLASFMDEGIAQSIQHPTEKGIIHEIKEAKFEHVAKQIVANIGNHPEMDLFFVIDHQSLAKKYRQELPKSLLLLLGNATTGTKLMLKKPSLSFDLPLKILVFETEDGNTGVAYNDMVYLFERHDIEDETIALKINELLMELTTLK